MLISINNEQKGILHDYMSQQDKFCEDISLLLSFARLFSPHYIYSVSPGDIDKLKRNTKIGNLFIGFPISDNKFYVMNNLVTSVKEKRINPTQIIIFEKQTPKVEEWIRTKLPIFKDIPIEGIHNMEHELCTIVWRKL